MLLPSLGVLALLGLSACAAGPADSVLGELPVGVWRLLPGSHVELSVSADQPVTLQFDAGRVSGDAGCNRYTGEAQLQDGRLSFGPIARTKRSCGDQRDALEQAYLDALHRGTGLRRAGERLQMLLDDGRLLEFAPHIGESP